MTAGWCSELALGFLVHALVQEGFDLTALVVHRERCVAGTREGSGAGEDQGEDLAEGAVLAQGQRGDRKSVVEGKRVSVRVDLGGRRIFTTKTQIAKYRQT